MGADDKGCPKNAADNFKTDLYKPYTYSGQCMKPPLLPNIEACPIDDKKHLTDGRTLAVPYPKAGYNCNPYGIHAQGGPIVVPMATDSLGLVQTQTEESVEAENGQPQVLYVPSKGDASLLKPKADLSKLQHCPDFNERMTLLDGKTRGIPYPEKGYNCNGDFGLSKKTPGK